MTRYPDISTPAALHTLRDAQTLTAAGISVNSRQPRENAVPCCLCRTQTWHLAGYCDRHYHPPA